MGAVAQVRGTATVRGVVLDSVSRQPEPYVTLRIVAKGQAKPLVMGLTEQDGTFQLKTPVKGQLVLVVSSVGKSPLSCPLVFDGKNELDLGQLYVGTSSKHLKGVEVVATKPLVKADIDKIEYNMADDPDAQTKNVLEMLRKVPMVTVDGEDNIKVNGSSSFKVYVNGKPNTMMSNNPKDVFRGIPANTIKKIEVITDPGARYDAEGVSGVLNIVTDKKTTMKGYNVSFNTQLGARQKGGGAFATMQYGKFMLSLNYSTGQYKQASQSNSSEREYFKSADMHYLNADSYSNYKSLYHFGELNGSYEIDSLNLISFSAGLWGMRGTTNADGRTTMSDEAYVPVYRYANVSSSKSSSYSVDAGVDYQHMFKRNKEEMLTFSYRLNTTPATDNFNSWYSDLWQVPQALDLNDLKSGSKTGFQEHTGQVDYTLPWKKHTLSVGAKFIHRLSTSDNTQMKSPNGKDEYVVDETQSLCYRHVNDIAAAYAEYKLSFKRFSLKSGVRYEYSYVGVSYPNGDRAGFHSHFSDLVPSVSAGYKLSDVSTLTLGYNMRISRPAISVLNPYVNRLDPTSISYGNPHLGTEKGNNLKLSFGSFTSKLNLNMLLYFGFSNNQSSSYTFLDKNQVLNTTYGNIVKYRGVAYGLSGNWTITRHTSFNVNGRIAWNHYRSDVLRQEKNGWDGFVAAGFQQKLPWDARLSLWGGGGTSPVNLQGTSPSFYFYSLTLSKSFLKENRMEVRAYFVNPIPKYLYSRSHIQTDGFVSRTLGKRKSFDFGFGLTYRIGRLDSTVKKAERTINNDDISTAGASRGTGDNSGQH